MTARGCLRGGVSEGVDLNEGEIGVGLNLKSAVLIMCEDTTRGSRWVVGKNGERGRSQPEHLIMCQDTTHVVCVSFNNLHRWVMR